MRLRIGLSCSSRTIIDSLSIINRLKIRLDKNEIVHVTF